MCREQLEREVVSAEFFFARDEFVDRLVAIVTQVDGLVHLRTSEGLLEPLVAMAGARNEVVLIRPSFSEASAQLAWLGHGWFSSSSRGASGSS